MPRGNDADAAAKELEATSADHADAFAKGMGNAEALINANNEAHSLELIQASNKKVDDKATAEALDNLDSFSGPNGEDAEDVAIRAGVTIVVYEDETGRLQKYIVSDDSDGKKSKADRKANARAKASSDTE